MTVTPTADEGRVVESYQRVLDEVARCAQAVRDGDRTALARAAEALARRATFLAVAAGEPRQGDDIRAAVVVAEVLKLGGVGGELARVLHPYRPAVTRPGLSNPFLHPDDPAAR